LTGIKQLRLEKPKVTKNCESLADAIPSVIVKLSTNCKQSFRSYEAAPAYHRVNIELCTFTH
jgi:hypothetical protein